MRVMFSKLTPKVAHYRFLKHINVFLFSSISHPIKLHFHRLGEFCCIFLFKIPSQVELSTLMGVDRCVCPIYSNVVHIMMTYIMLLKKLYTPPQKLIP